MKKLYGEFNQQDWLQASKMTLDQVPESIILHGEDGNIFENISEWEPVFDSIISRPRWNMIIGKKKNKVIGFTNVIWAPMTALIVHRFAMMGTKKFIQIGYCGGLKSELAYGDILLVDKAYSEDGVSNQYWSDRNIFLPDDLLFRKTQSLLSSQDYPYKIGSIVTTSAMLLETKESISAWQKQGLWGVDGEIATTFAIAEKYNAKAISLLTCSDNLALGDTFYNNDENRLSLEEDAFEKIQNIAFEIAMA